MGRSGTRHVAMVTKLLSSYFGAHLVESYCKNQTFLIKIGWDIFFDHIWSKFSIWRHHLADLHILKTWISLEQTEIFESLLSLLEIVSFNRMLNLKEKSKRSKSMRHGKIAIYSKWISLKWVPLFRLLFS